MKDIKNKKEEDSCIILYIFKEGNPYWIISSEDITEKQEELFLKINTVIGKPSLVLLFFLKIEMILIYLSYKIESFFKIKK